MESEPMLTPQEKSPLPENSPQRRFEPTTLHQAGQRAQHITNELFRPHKYIKVPSTNTQVAPAPPSPIPPPPTNSHYLLLS